jgi:hypothetical protein
MNKIKLQGPISLQHLETSSALRAPSPEEKGEIIWGFAEHHASPLEKLAPSD